MKHVTNGTAGGVVVVAPRAGAWIETLPFADVMSLRRSRPARARGLKLWCCGQRGITMSVAPRAGAWIETGIEMAVRTGRRGRAPRGRVD